MNFYKMLVKEFPGTTAMLFGFWFILGLMPLLITVWFQPGYLQFAGQLGDSFGAATSLFTSIGSIATGGALLLQFRQNVMLEKSQEEQGKAQLEQTRLANRTAEIQDLIRKESRLQLVINALVGIERASALYVSAHDRWNNLSPQERSVDRSLGDALAEVLSSGRAVKLHFGDRAGNMIAAINRFRKDPNAHFDEVRETLEVLWETEVK